MIAFTICSRNFLAYAQTLHLSLLETNEDVIFYVALCDDTTELDLSAFNFEVITIDAIGIPKWEEMRERYNVTELNTSIKPFVFLYLFDLHPGEIIHYFDPDILAVSRFDELHDAAAGADCVLTPHITLPDEFSEATDRAFLLYGVYNLGFCALRATPEVERAVSWWARRLERDCVIDLAKGLFVDQKWADLLPSYIDRTTLLRHPGYNVAYWNLSQRSVVRLKKRWLVNGVPLRFFHFSGNQIESPGVFARHNPNLTLENIGEVRWLLAEYRRSVLRQGHSFFIGLPYAFAGDSAGRENEHTHASILEARRRAADSTPFLPLLPARTSTEQTNLREKLSALLTQRHEADQKLASAPGSTAVSGYCFACGQQSTFKLTDHKAWDLKLCCNACGLTSSERALLQILVQHLDPAASDGILLQGHPERLADWLRVKLYQVSCLDPFDVTAQDRRGADFALAVDPFSSGTGVDALPRLLHRLRPGGKLLVSGPFLRERDEDPASPWATARVLQEAGFADVTLLSYWSRDLCYLGDPHYVLLASRPSAPDSNLKIALVGHDAKPHGAQVLLLHLARRIATNNEISAQILLGGSGVLVEQYRENLPTEVIEGGIDNLAVWEKAALRLKERGVTAVICNTLVAAKALCPFRAAGLRTVILVHELPKLIEEYSLLDAARAAALQGDVVVFASRYVHDRFIETAGTIRHRRIIRPQGIYLGPSPKQDQLALRAAKRATLGASERDLIVLSAAFGDYRKGIDIWCGLVGEIRRKFRRVVFVWAGLIDPKMNERVEEVRGSSEQSRHVQFVGQVEDLPSFYAAADIFLLPSREDPFPSVALEAMAHGLPVVAFAESTGMTALLEQTGNQPVPYLDVQAMAKRLLDLLRNADLREQIAEKSRRRMEQDYDFPSYVADLCNFLTDAPRAVSVVVPNYNYAHYLRERIGSILRQTYPVHEIIILDDASTDESAAIIAEIESEIKVKLKVVYNEVNSGSVSRQWMRGVDLAEGELVWIAEADDLADPGFLAATVPAFDDYDVVLSYSQSRQIDGQGKILREDYFDYLEDVDPVQWRTDYVRSGAEEIAEALSVKNTIPNVSAAVFRRKALKRVLSENSKNLFAMRNAADWYCYLHLLRQGSVTFSARTLNSHRRHTRSVTLSTNDRQHYNEIREMQQLAASLVNVPAEKMAAAQNWLEAVAKLFRLAAD